MNLQDAPDWMTAVNKIFSPVLRKRSVKFFQRIEKGDFLRRRGWPLYLLVVYSGVMSVNTKLLVVILVAVVVIGAAVLVVMRNSNAAEQREFARQSESDRFWKEVREKRKNQKTYPIEPMRDKIR